MLDLLRRAAALTLLSAVGIALLAPVAARSVAPVPVERIEALLAPPSTAAPLVTAERSSLTARAQPPAAIQAAGRREVDTEVLASVPMPTPASAPMEAVLHVIATPKPVAVAPAAPAAPAAPVDMGSVWDRLAQCESGGNWAITSPNGTYMGGLQFNYQTWHAYGGGEYAEYPHHATREQQIAIAEKLHAARGFQPWPACRVKLGLP